MTRWNLQPVVLEEAITHGCLVSQYQELIELDRAQRLALDLPHPLEHFVPRVLGQPRAYSSAEDPKEPQPFQNLVLTLHGSSKRCERWVTYSWIRLCQPRRASDFAASTLRRGGG